jgi:hypothetical protein
MNFQQYFSARQSRRDVLRQLGTLTAAGLALDACGTTSTTHPTGPTTSGSGSIESIKHMVICCQENRTFDTYLATIRRLETSVFRQATQCLMAREARLSLIIFSCTTPKILLMIGLPFTKSGIMGKWMALLL